MQGWSAAAAAPRHFLLAKGGRAAASGTVALAPAPLPLFPHTHRHTHSGSPPLPRPPTRPAPPHLPLPLLPPSRTSPCPSLPSPPPADDRTFSQVVAEAKAAGYTEPDPRDDLAGMDVARKVTILARWGRRGLLLLCRGCRQAGGGVRGAAAGAACRQAPGCAGACACLCVRARVCACAHVWVRVRCCHLWLCLRAPLPPAASLLRPPRASPAAAPEGNPHWQSGAPRLPPPPPRRTPHPTHPHPPPFWCRRCRECGMSVELGDVPVRSLVPEPLQAVGSGEEYMEVRRCAAAAAAGSGAAGCVVGARRGALRCAGVGAFVGGSVVRRGAVLWGAAGLRPGQARGRRALALPPSWPANPPPLPHLPPPHTPPACHPTPPRSGCPSLTARWRRRRRRRRRRGSACGMWGWWT